MGATTGNARLRRIAAVGVAGAALVSGCAPAPSSPAPELGEVVSIGAGPDTLVLIPCMGCRWRSWDTFMERNDARFAMWAVTLPGFGGSPAPALPQYADADEWHDHAARAVGAMLESEGLTNVTLVGHSFGAFVAAHVAALYPGRVRGVVALDSSVLSGAARDPALAREIREQYIEPLGDPDRWQEFNTPSIRDPDRRRLYHGWMMASDPIAVSQYWWGNLVHDERRTLEPLRVPILDVQALTPGEDAAEARSAFVERLRIERLPRAYQAVFLPETPHFVMEEAPEELDEILTHFVGRDDSEPFPPGAAGSDGLFHAPLAPGGRSFYFFRAAPTG